MPLRLSFPGARLFRARPRPQYHPQHRPSSSQPQPQSTNTSTSQLRIRNLLDRVPRFLYPYVSGLRSAPGTHISSFLVLHELTAIIPLVLLGMGFHYSGWLPGGLDEEKVLSYMSKFGSYFSKKSWFDVSAPPPSSSPIPNVIEGFRHGKEGEVVHKILDHDEEKRILIEGKYGSGTRIVLEVAMAYAITKVLLPVRILGSLWATPWFARRVLSAFRRFRR